MSNSFKLFENKKFLIFLILINILSSIIAFSYYQAQLTQNSILLWIFIADCPIFALFFSYVLYKKLKNQDSVFITFISLVGILKYSIWTLFVIFLTTNPLNNLLIVFSHILFLIEIIVFYKFYAFKIKHVIFALPIFLISDFFDYIILTHPPINLNFFNEIAIFSIFLSFFAVFFVAIFLSKK